MNYKNRYKPLENKRNRKSINAWVLIGIFICLFLNSGTFAQITFTTPNITPADAVNNVLLGAGVTASNITYNGSPFQSNSPQSPVHEFTNTSATFPIDNGILLETNNSNTISDPDLSAITTNNVTNGVIIEFDFIPDGDSLSFSYIFASREYTSFTCSNYNDVFGFFISGPGISGPFTNNAQNIAVVPGSNNIPVGINTVNAGTDPDYGNNCFNADPNWQANSVFFTTAYNSVYNSSSYISTNYNGSTVELNASANVICGQTYHIKIAISNVGDQAYDSGVFLRAGSFSSDPVIDINGFNLTSNFLDSVIVEGCDDGSFCFSRPMSDTIDTAVVHYSISGSATYGSDYTFTNLPNQGDSIVLLPGENEICLDFTLNDDGINEDYEDIVLTSYSINACGDTIFSSGSLWIADRPTPLNPNAGSDTVVCNGGSGYLNGTATTSTNDIEWSYNGPGTITFSPNTQDLNAEITFDTPGVYSLYLTESNDTCALEEIDTMIVTYGELGISTSNDTTICENGTATLIATAIGGNNIDYHWGHTNDTQAQQLVQPTNQTDYTVYAENQSGCSSDTLTISVDVLPSLSVTSSPTQAICPGDSAKIFATASDGNGGPYNYEWTDPLGNVVGSTDTIIVHPESTTIYTVTVTDGCESSAQTATTEVVFDALPDVLFSVTDNGMCSPASFEVINNSDPSLIDETHWKISDGQTFDLLDTINVELDKAGIYDVQLTVVTPNGCIDSATQVGMLTVYPNPRADFIFIPNPVTILNTKVQFQNGTFGATQYEWNFEKGNPNYSTMEDPTIKFPEGEIDNYEVTLIATSEFGCIDTAVKTIVVQPEVLLFAPNAFTPDGDEHNNVWRPELSGVDIYSVTIQIFNRWGEVMWESHDLNTGWNGTYGEGGKKVEPGTYVWKIKAADRITDNKYEWAGHVTVLY